MTEENNQVNTSEVEGLQEKLIAAERQAQENLIGWQRAQADYANLRKENERHAREVMEFANAAFMSEVLPVYSHFKLALQHIPENVHNESWFVGIENIRKQFQEFFKKYNITEIKTVGEKFDPNIHEAITHEEKEGFESDVVFEEVQPGYMLGDKVVQPARVRVAK